MENIRVSLKPVCVHLSNSDLNTEVSMINIKHNNKELFIKINNNDVLKCREFLDSTNALVEAVQLKSIAVAIETASVRCASLMVHRNFIIIKCGVQYDWNDSEGVNDVTLEEFKIYVD